MDNYHSLYWNIKPPFKKSLDWLVSVFSNHLWHKIWPISTITLISVRMMPIKSVWKSLYTFWVGMMPKSQKLLHFFPNTVCDHDQELWEQLSVWPNEQLGLNQKDYSIPLDFGSFLVFRSQMCTFASDCEWGWKETPNAISKYPLKYLASLR